MNQLEQLVKQNNIFIFIGNKKEAFPNSLLFYINRKFKNDKYKRIT